MLEVEVMRQDGRPAPSLLQKHHWEHLLTLASRNQRSSYLLYLWKTEIAKQNEKVIYIVRKDSYFVYNERTQKLLDQLLKIIY